MTRHTSAALLLVLLVTGVTFAPGAAAADNGDGLLSGVIGSVNDSDGDGMTVDDGAARYLDATAAGLDRFMWGISQANPFSDGAETTAKEELTGVQSSFNSNNSTLQSYLNERVNASSESDVAKLTLHINGETATRYLTANVSGDNYSELQMRSSLPEGRSVDDTTHVCGMAAVKAEEELNNFVTKFAEPNKNITQEYRAKMAGKYGKDVESTLLETDGSCGGDS